MPAMEVHKAMAAEVTEAATVPASSAMEGVETSTVKSATMETTAVESASAMEAAATMSTTAAMATTANLYQTIGCDVGGR